MIPISCVYIYMIIYRYMIIYIYIYDYIYIYIYIYTRKHYHHRKQNHQLLDGGLPRYGTAPLRGCTRPHRDDLPAAEPLLPLLPAGCGRAPNAASIRRGSSAVRSADGRVSSQVCSSPSLLSLPSIHYYIH